MVRDPTSSFALKDEGIQRKAVKELEEATKGRETNTKVLALGWGLMILGPLADTRKSGSLLRNQALPGFTHCSQSWGVITHVAAQNILCKHG